MSDEKKRRPYKPRPLYEELKGIDENIRQISRDRYKIDFVDIIGDVSEELKPLITRYFTRNFANTHIEFNYFWINLDDYRKIRENIEASRSDKHTFTVDISYFIYGGFVLKSLDSQLVEFSLDKAEGF